MIADPKHTDLVLGSVGKMILRTADSSRQSRVDLVRVQDTLDGEKLRLDYYTI